jgi:hypothetical protein
MVERCDVALLLCCVYPLCSFPLPILRALMVHFSFVTWESGISFNVVKYI